MSRGRANDLRSGNALFFGVRAMACYRPCGRSDCNLGNSNMNENDSRAAVNPLMLHAYTNKFSSRGNEAGVYEHMMTVNLAGWVGVAGFAFLA